MQLASESWCVWGNHNVDGLCVADVAIVIHRGVGRGSEAHCKERASRAERARRVRAQPQNLHLHLSCLQTLPPYVSCPSGG